MYTVISGIGRLKSVGSRWLTEDFAPMLITDVIAQYEQVYFKVANKHWDTTRVVTLSSLAKKVASFTHTVQQVFDSLGNETISNIEGEAVVQNRYVKAADAVQADYTLKRVKKGMHPDIIVSPHEADTLVMSKMGVDPVEFNKYCLVSINGLIHYSDSDNKDIYVEDAQTSSRVSRRNEVGVINFKEIGELTKLPITEDMLHKRVPDQPFGTQVYIQVPPGYESKTAMIVIGGYLQFLDGHVFKRVADDIFGIEIQAINLIDRYLESKELIDLDFLELDKYGKNEAQFIRSELFSDERITKYLTMSQSFIVFVDSDTIRVDKERLTTGMTYGQYISPKKPSSPLALGFGLMAPYWLREDDKLWSLTVGDNLRNNLLIQTNEPKHVPYPADNRIPYDREEISPANLWHISSEVIVIVKKVRS